MVIVHKHKNVGVRLINYVLTKKDKELVYNTFLSNNPDRIKEQLEIIHNDCTKSNESHHWVLSSAKGEDYTPEQWKSYINEFMQKLNIENHSFFAVRHNDGECKHIHLVVAGSEAGKVPKEMQGFYKKSAAELANTISIRDNHMKPIVGKTQLNQKSKAYNNYMMDRIIKKHLKKSGRVGEELSNLGINNSSKSLTNAQWKKKLPKKLYSQLLAEAKTNDLRQIFCRKLKSIQNTYLEQNPKGSLEGFVNYMNSQPGSYAKELRGSGVISYGLEIEGKMIYFDEKELHFSFDQSKLTQTKGKKIPNTNRIITQRLRFSKTLREQVTGLKKMGMELHLRINKNGVYAGFVKDNKTKRQINLSELDPKIKNTIHQLVISKLNPQELENISFFANTGKSVTMNAENLIFDTNISKNFNVKNINQNINANSEHAESSIRSIDKEQFEDHSNDFSKRKKSV